MNIQIQKYHSLIENNYCNPIAHEFDEFLFKL